MGEFRIIIDTREQTPWGFPPEIPVEVATLKTGDYAVAGDSAFAIERKSKDDFLGTISTGWGRFCRELNRAAEAGFRIFPVVVEADYASFCFGEHNGRIIPPDHEHYRLTPKFIMLRIAELTQRGAAVIFAGNAELASGLALRILRKRYEVLRDGNCND